MEKPCQQINKVIASLINFIDVPSDIHTFPSRTVQDTQLIADDVLIILEGCMRVYGRKNSLLLGEITGPYILNLVPEVMSKSYIVCESSQFSYLAYPRSTFYAHVEAQNLWQDMFYILSYSSKLLGEQLEVMKFRSLYDVVKYYLIKINEYEELKQRENVCNYIVSRTGYSKSGVMAILKELRKGGYIETSNGRLAWVKTLPLRF